jgi:hypothetical protein
MPRHEYIVEIWVKMPTVRRLKQARCSNSAALAGKALGPGETWCHRELVF